MTAGAGARIRYNLPHTSDELPETAMKKKDELIQEIQPGRRDFIRKALGAGFAVPVVATFTMTGLMSRPASAGANQS